MTRARGDLVAGAVAGLVAGLVATWAKGRFQDAWNKVQSASSPPEKSQASPQGAAPSSQSEQSEPSTVKAAEAVSRGVFGHDLSEPEKRVAGPVVDFAFGTISGVAYGAAAEVVPPITKGSGSLFAVGLWAIADELGLAALGLAKWPSRYPASTHLYALAGHLVYGSTLELGRRVVRRALAGGVGSR